MKDNDIIKALHTACLLDPKNIFIRNYITGEITTLNMDDVLNLINRQQTEIEKLKIDLEAMRGAANSYKMHYEKAKEELDEIEKEHKYLKKELDKYDPFYFCSIGGCEGASNTCWKDCADSMYNVTRVEAVKEFVKSLIDKTNGEKISSTDILEFMVDYL